MMQEAVLSWLSSAVGSGMWGTRGCFFTFHRSAPSPVWPTLPNRDFYLDSGFLDELLGYLSRTGWDVVTIEEALLRMSNPKRGRNGRFVNFSVDDCYRDTAEIVVPVFRKHGVPVTLFVTTGIPDGTLPLWQAGLEAVIAERDSVVTDQGARATASSEAKRRLFAEMSTLWDAGDPARRYAAFCRANGVTEGSLYDSHAMTWPMLRALSGDPCVEIGAHTISHRRLSTLPEGEAAAEIGGSGNRLREQLGVACRHFAFPFGRRGDCGPREFEITRRTGFASASTTVKGLLRAGQDPFSLPRNTLNGAHRSTLLAEAHLLGLTGLAARALGRV